GRRAPRRAAARGRLGHRQRAAPAARHHHRRRPAPVAGADALLDAGHLPRDGAARARVRPPARGRRGRSGLNPTAPVLRRPVATTLLAIAIFLAGAAAFTQLPIAPLPRVDYPTIGVNASLPGASPSTMASAVATPLERRFGRIAGLNEMTSTSALGTTDITLQFDLARDVDSVARDVQAAINAAGGDLPANLPTRPRYNKVNPSDSPILIFALMSSTLPPEQIYDAANSVLAQKIAQVQG